MTKTQKSRLRALAETVEKIPRGRLDMRYYKNVSWTCHTVACLAGWHVIFNPRISLCFDRSLLKNRKTGEFGPFALMAYFKLDSATTDYVFFHRKKSIREVRRRVHKACRHYGVDLSDVKGSKNHGA